MTEHYDRTIKLGDAEHDFFAAGGMMHVTTRSATRTVTSVISEDLSPDEARTLAGALVEAADACEKQVEFARVFGHQLGQAA